MGKTKRLSLGAQKKKKKIKPSKRNKMRLLKKVVDYLKSDSYMLAPLINSIPPKINSSFATGLKIKEPNEGKNERLLKKIVDYLKSNSYMYASFLAPQAISSPPKDLQTPLARASRSRLPKAKTLVEGEVPTAKSDDVDMGGSIRYVKRVHMEISRTTLTMEDNQATVRSANVMAEDQFFEGNLLETSISDSQTLAHKEIAKNMVYPNCRSSSISEMLDSQLRKLLVD